MSSNITQSLQDIIDGLPTATKILIMETTSVSDLLRLKQKHADDADIATVIEARIANINYLVP